MATVGPTLETPSDLRSAIEAGAGWFRLPCGYRQRPHLENALAVRSASAAAGVPVALLLDLPSSRPRTGSMPEARLSVGNQVLFWDAESGSPGPTRNGALPVPLPGLRQFFDKLAPRQAMWFCDGRLQFVIEGLEERAVLARLVKGEVPLKSSNSLFLPETPSAFTATTAADWELLRALDAAGVVPDWIALSLIASPDDVQTARQAIRHHLSAGVRIMAKFETAAAVDCAEQIVAVADGIMVARGDLGLAVGYTRLPGVQEDLVDAARRAGKQSIVATQILEVFAETGLPQRAELTDLAVVARQQATGIMLGKETVFSPRPIDCIRFAREVMAREVQRMELRLAAPEPGGLPG
jgi:pyruvate kinase